MDYETKNTGGIGIIIDFPESVGHESIRKSIGRYRGVNIERLEIEAIIQGMKLLLEIFKSEREIFTEIRRIIFITDRLKLCDSERTNPYKIRDWRKQGWKSYEGKPIKNADLLDEVDKLRLKINKNTRCGIQILYARRKYNRRADKAAALGKKGGIMKTDIQVKGIKLGRRIFQGSEVDYRRISTGQELVVYIYKKEPLGDLWEISTEICEGDLSECTLKIIIDNRYETLLHRNHAYLIRVKVLYQHHIEIEDSFEEYILK